MKKTALTLAVLSVLVLTGCARRTAAPQMAMPMAPDAPPPSFRTLEK